MSEAVSRLTTGMSLLTTPPPMPPAHFTLPTDLTGPPAILNAQLFSYHALPDSAGGWGAGVGPISSEEGGPLHIAARYNNAAALEFLLLTPQAAPPSDINATHGGGGGLTPLHVAADWRSREAARVVRERAGREVGGGGRGGADSVVVFLCMAVSLYNLIFVLQRSLSVVDGRLWCCVVLPRSCWTAVRTPAGRPQADNTAAAAAAAAGRSTTTSRV